ncbi:MAG: DUF3800 domain-containing protein [Bacteroidales bacterium]|nr:DUF3800 domain-containing protein [Bacteroidales bacterium]
MLELDVYADEIWPGKKRNWIYIGALFVPLNKKEELLRKLMGCRCPNGDWKEKEEMCKNRCRQHENHDREIHYRDANDHYKFRIAKEWIEMLLDNNKRNLGLVYFNILGLDLFKIKFDLFNPKNKKMSVYNRFFRTVLLSGIKYFFNDSNIIVNSVFHDKGEQEYYELFSWHFAYKISKENNIRFNNNEIIFVDSNHKKSHSLESHFIQFLDVIMGSVFSCFHPPENRNKRILGEKIKPLVYRLTKAPKNKNSSYNYYRKQQIQFFPRHDLKEPPEERTLFNEQLKPNRSRFNNFYTDRKILLENSNQKTLDEW